MNLAAFEWGRRAAFDLAAAEEAAGVVVEEREPSLAEIVERRAAFLSDYSNGAYSERYRKAVERSAAAEARVMPGATALSIAVAQALFKLMAVKDEYEVARLFVDGSFERQLKSEFESWDRLEFHMAPPLLGRRDRHGHLKKQSFGSWMVRALWTIARFKALRGTRLDPFGHTRERKWERQLLSDYLSLLDTIAERLSAANWETACALAAYPLKIRGFGHVKEAQARPALAERDQLLKAFLEPKSAQLAEAAE